MDISTLGSVATGAASLPYQVSVTMLRKALDIASTQSSQLLSTVAQETGVGSLLDITA